MVKNVYLFSVEFDANGEPGGGKLAVEIVSGDVSVKVSDIDITNADCRRIARALDACGYAARHLGGVDFIACDGAA